MVLEVEVISSNPDSTIYPSFQLNIPYVGFYLLKNRGFEPTCDMSVKILIK